MTVSFSHRHKIRLQNEKLTIVTLGRSWSCFNNNRVRRSQDKYEDAALIPDICMAHFVQPDCWCASIDDEMCESDEVERAASAGALHNFYPLEANLYPGERMLRPFPGLLLWDLRDPPGPLGCSIAYVPPPMGWTTLYTNAGLQLHVWVGDMRPQAPGASAALQGATTGSLPSSLSASGGVWRPPAGTLLPSCNGQTQVVGLNLPPAPPMHEHRCIACGRRGLNVDVVPIGGNGGAGGCVGGRSGDHRR